MIYTIRQSFIFQQVWRISFHKTQTIKNLPKSTYHINIIFYYILHPPKLLFSSIPTQSINTTTNNKKTLTTIGKQVVSQLYHLDYKTHTIVVYA